MRPALSASFPRLYDLFGRDVALNGETLVVATNGPSDGAFVFTLDANTQMWTEVAKLTSTDNGSQFGTDRPPRVNGRAFLAVSGILRLMDIRKYNREAWDAQVEQKNRWTIPVSAETIARARAGQWKVVLTPRKPVPRAWFPDLRGCRVLALASGGGQQGPTFAAAGATVTVLDNSPRQLDQDRHVAEREGLTLALVQGAMADLGRFADGSFDLVFHPCANCFCENIRPVWEECFRVLSPGGTLLGGFGAPAMFIFDAQKLEQGQFVVRHRLPYSELTDITPEERQAFMDKSEPLMFGHTLDEQIGGQLEAGFVLLGMFEDSDPDNALSQHMPTYIATRAQKPQIVP